MAIKCITFLLIHIFQMWMVAPGFKSRGIKCCPNIHGVTRNVPLVPGCIKWQAKGPSNYCLPRDHSPFIRTVQLSIQESEASSSWNPSLTFRLDLLASSMLPKSSSTLPSIMKDPPWNIVSSSALCTGLGAIRGKDLCLQHNILQKVCGSLLSQIRQFH